MRNPIPILSTVFFEDLNRVAQEKRVLLCFDNYEFTRNYLDDWLLHLADHKPSQNIRLAIAGRTPPGPSWERFRNVVMHVPLDIFTPEEADRFLDQHNIHNEQRRKEIMDFSGRLPVIMSWLAAPEGNEPDPTVPTGDIVDRFLRWVKDRSLRQAALYAALPRYLNLDVLTTLLESEANSIPPVSEFDWVVEQPFVSQRQRGWEYHEVVRRYMLHYQRNASNKNYRKLHARLANYYEVKRSELKLPEMKLWGNEHWRQFTLEYLYHHLAAQPDEHWADFLSVFTVALRKRRSFAQEIVTLALLAATRDELGEEQRQDVEMFSEQLAAMQNGSLKDGLMMLERLCSIQGLTPEACAYAFAQRGDAYRTSDRLNDALRDYNTANDLFPDTAWIIERRGRTRQLLEQFNEALADFDHAIQIRPDYAPAYQHRGQVYGQIGRVEEALADFEQALKLDPDNMHSIQKDIGITLKAAGRYRESVTAIQQALSAGPTCSRCWVLLAQAYEVLYPRDQVPGSLRQVSVPDAETAPVIACRAEAMRYTRHYEEALIEFNRALEHNPDDSWAIASRGEVYEALSYYDLALSDFDRAIALRPNYSWVFLKRGQLYRHLNRYAEAIRDFERAIEIDPYRAHEGQKEIGLTLLAKEKHREAIDAFIRALAAESACSECWTHLANSCRALYAWDEIPSVLRQMPIPDVARASVIACRAEAMRRIGHNDEALLDFNIALEKNPNDPWITACRGLVRMTLQRYEEALSDFNRAMELKHDEAWSFYYRAEVLRLMGKYEESLADLDQAIVLNPTAQDEWLNTRGLVLSHLGRFSEAADSYRKAIEESGGSDLSAQYNLAVVTARWKGLESAKTAIEEIRKSFLDVLNTDARDSALYGLGGLAAVEGDASQALAHLKEALSVAPTLRGWAMHDIAWLNLRGDSRFQALMSETN